MNRPREGKNNIKITFKEYLLTSVVNTPQKMPKGGNNTMGQPHKQVQQNIHGLDNHNSKWKQHVSSARISQSMLSDYDSLKSKAHSRNLGGLSQQRHSISRREADEDVRNFIDKYKI